jgi:hypothetical protein
MVNEVEITPATAGQVKNENALGEKGVTNNGDSLSTSSISDAAAGKKVASVATASHHWKTDPHTLVRFINSVDERTIGPGQQGDAEYFAQMFSRVLRYNWIEFELTKSGPDKFEYIGQLHSGTESSSRQKALIPVKDFTFRRVEFAPALALMTTTSQEHAGHRPFLEFHELRSLATEFNGFAISEVAQKLEEKEQKTKGENTKDTATFEPLGMKIPAKESSFLGVIILVSAQMYLLIYLRQLMGKLHVDDPGWDVPWIGMDGSAALSPTGYDGWRNAHTVSC